LFEKRLYGHRGAPLELPENTLVSFAKALEHGVNAIETDVQVTADGVVVISHDGDGRRLCGVDAAIAQTPLAEVQRWRVAMPEGTPRPDGVDPDGLRIPTLQEALERFPDTFFNIDIKAESSEAVERVIRTIRLADAEKRVILASFHASNLDEVAARDFGGGLSMGKRDVRVATLLPAFLARLFLGPRHAIQIPTHSGDIRLDTEARIKKFHGLNLRVDYWTVDDPAEANRLWDLGADGIMTDDAARLGPIFKSRFRS
jgi:glycerophosphoryl diester phosphodiesterase